MTVRFCLIAAALVGALTGCGSPGPVQTYPVSGQVIYAGKPAAGVQVFLLPTSAPMVPDVPSNPRGVTGADGRFTLGTYSADDGAAEGGYQIVLLWPEKKSPEDEEAIDRLLGWYDGARSQLTARITTGNNTLPTINLPAVTRPPEATAGIPGRN